MVKKSRQKWLKIKNKTLTQLFFEDPERWMAKRHERGGKREGGVIVPGSTMRTT